MNWEKLKPNHYFKEPVEYIYSSTIFDIKEYDRLYENQNNLSHQVWKDFDSKYSTGFQFHEDLTEINRNKEVMCLWFYKDRNDRSAGEVIELAGKKITYFPNAFLITESKDIKIIREKRNFIRRPCLQIDLDRETYNQIIGKIKQR